MKDNELSSLTIKELKDLQLRIEGMIAARATEERNGLREKFRQMAEAAGLSLSDVVGGGGSLRGGKTGKVAAKFANPMPPPGNLVRPRPATPLAGSPAQGWRQSGRFSPLTPPRATPRSAASRVSGPGRAIGITRPSWP